MIRKSFYWSLLLFFSSLIMQSCAVNSNLMFKTPKGEFIDTIPLFPVESYKISPDDKITFTLATNKGANIIVGLAGVEQGNFTGKNSSLEYTVRRNGEVELPVIGNMYIAGLSVEECEDELEKRFSVEYQEPFVQVRVTNQRVIVFPGNGSDAKVIPLINSNTTLMEAIAQAGGITERGKANSIKIMRIAGGKRNIYTIDLSTIDGLRYADMVVQANDYIYIDPVPQLPKEVLQEAVPVISLFSSLIFVLITVNNLK